MNMQNHDANCIKSATKHSLAHHNVTKCQNIYTQKENVYFCGLQNGWYVLLNYLDCGAAFLDVRHVHSFKRWDVVQFSLRFNRYECQQIKSPTPNSRPIRVASKVCAIGSVGGKLKGAHYLPVNYNSRLCAVCVNAVVSYGERSAAVPCLVIPRPSHISNGEVAYIFSKWSWAKNFALLVMRKNLDIYFMNFKYVYKIIDCA